MRRMGIAILLVFVPLCTLLGAAFVCAQTDATPASTPSVSDPGAAQVPAETAPRAATATPQVEPPAGYVIQGEDVIRISVMGEPELSTEQIVDPRGAINVPMLGSVQAKGLSKVQLADQLTKEYSEYFVEPKVQVSLLQYRRPRVYVVGQVYRPSTFELRVGDGVMEAVAQAGSFTPNSSLAGATLTHQGSKERIPLDLHKLFFEGDMSQNLTLQDGDTVYIPEDVKNRFFVLGEVNRPGKYTLKEGLTVMDAISEAGGANPRANAKNTYIVRGDPKNPQRIKIDVPKFLKNADVSQNVVLEPGDLIYVPESKKPDWSKLSSIMGVVINSSYLVRYLGL